MKYLNAVDGSFEAVDAIEGISLASWLRSYWVAGISQCSSTKERSLLGEVEVARYQGNS